jgi:hypothetical protein
MLDLACKIVGDITELQKQAIKGPACVSLGDVECLADCFKRT